MAIEIIMPKAGMAMEEGTIIKWLKAEGDVVEQGEPLLEILTDKVNMEVEAQVSGTLLKILKQEGDVVPVIQTIGYIGAPGEKLDSAGSASESKGAGTEGAMLSLSIDEDTVQKKVSSGSGVNQGSIDHQKEAFGYDVVVIGGGPAGYVAAIKAAQLGGKVALVEQDVVGGTCLNRGCIPTKTYLKNAEIIDTIRHAAQRGIHLAGAEVSLDMEKIVAVKNEVVKTLTTGVAGLLRSYGVTTYPGIGRITKEKKVSVDGKEVLETKNIIIAGGSKPSKLKIPGMESKLVLTSDEILDLAEVPKRLAIIGGGVIGIELATVFEAYGSKVTIIEMENRLAPFMDGEISAELKKHAEKKGIILMTGTKLEKMEERDGKLLITTDKGTLEADKGLLSIGRVADLEALGELELETERGKIKVNESLQTSEAGIYAAGDITGKLMLAHAAFKMGEIAAVNAMGGREKVDLRYTPSAIYTSPEIGSVGLTEEVAKENYEVSVGKFHFGANGRALASGEGTGFVKVIADKKYGQILGVHIVGPAAAELINEAAALMSMEITVHELSEIIHGHPTFSEALMEAAADCLHKCIHKPRPSKSGQSVRSHHEHTRRR